MPYKDKSKSREAWRRWKENHPDIHRERQVIQKQSVYANPDQEECSIDECSKLGERHHPDYKKPKDIIWLCKKHHEAEHHKNEKKCKIVDCDSKHHAHGYCNRHMKKWKRGTL